MLSDNLIKRFQALHLKMFGKTISHSEAQFELRLLADLIRITISKHSKKERGHDR